MCVIFIAYGQRADHPLILIANRDEYYARNSAAAGYWEDFPDIYGGRDLQGGGTWLGVTRSGRFAAVTNYRDPSAPTGSRSRGDLVADFLKSDLTALIYLKEIQETSDKYSGFNLIVGEMGERGELFYYSNRGGDPVKLPSGIYGLSNHLLDTAWPKVKKGKVAFEKIISGAEVTNDGLFEILSDQSLAADDELPLTGIGYEAEKAISAIFIKTPGYGTRCSAVLKFDQSLKWSFEERVFV